MTTIFTTSLKWYAVVISLAPDCANLWSQTTIFALKIEDALRQLAKLKAFFSRPSMALASQILYLDNPGASGAVPDVEHPDRLRAFAKQIDALLYLDGWVRDLADRFERKGYGIAPKSAEKPGRNDLVLDLADLWRRRSGETELSVGRKSCWIKFLQQGLATIADLSVTGDAARKMTMRALKYEPSQMRQAAKRPLEI
jgi:hypothetical protein